LVITLTVLWKDLAVPIVYWSSFVACMLCGVFNAICSGGVFSMAAHFPPIFMQALMSGQGLSGVAVASISLAVADSDKDQCDDETYNDNGSGQSSGSGGGSGDGCRVYGKKSVDWGALAYFVAALGCFAACVVCFLVLERSRFAAYYARDEGDGEEASSSDAGETYVPLHDDGDRAVRREDDGPAEAPVSATGDEAESAGQMEKGDLATSDSASTKEPCIIPAIAETLSPESLHSIGFYKRVLWLMRREVFAVWFAFAVTIAVFPSVASKIEPASLRDGCGGGGPFSQATFTALLFLVFNLMDLAGRSGAGFMPAIPSEWLPAAALLRVGFVPLFALCRVRGSRLPAAFQSSAWPLAFMAGLAFSNGYIGTLAMICGPQRVTRSGADKDMAGSVMILALTAGLTSGSGLSYLVSWAITG